LAEEHSPNRGYTGMFSGSVAVITKHGFELCHHAVYSSGFEKLYTREECMYILNEFERNLPKYAEPDFLFKGTFNAADALKCLNIALKAINKKSKLPVLCNVLIQICNGRMYFVGTNLEKYAIKSCDYSGDDFAITLPVLTLRDWLRLVEGQVSISVGGAYNSLVELQSGNAVCCVNGIAAENFPPVVDVSLVVQEGVFPLKDEEQNETE
jgi:hypothetical protein